MLERGARDDRVELLLAERARERVRVRNDVDVRAVLQVRTEELGRVGHPVAVHRGSPWRRLPSAELKHARCLEALAQRAELRRQRRALGSRYAAHGEPAHHHRGVKR